MTKEEIIELAREVGFDVRSEEGFQWLADTDNLEPIERFANLVAAKERERCAQMAESCAYMSENFNALAEEIRSLK